MRDNAAALLTSYERLEVRQSPGGGGVQPSLPWRKALTITSKSARLRGMAKPRRHGFGFATPRQRLPIQDAQALLTGGVSVFRSQMRSAELALQKRSQSNSNGQTPAEDQQCQQGPRP
jgi:hypothetical protein